MKTQLNNLKTLYSHYRGTLLFSLLLLATGSKAQVNAYARVSAISGTTLTLTDVNQTYHTFNNGDQIIIMQMQDNVIGSNTTNTSSFGNISGISNAGKFETVTIASVSGMPNSLTIAGTLTNTFHTGPNSSVQIISFRKYGSPNYTTTAAITALPWNGKVGGVVAVQVPGTLTLAHSITANAAGFRGGVVSGNFESGCQPAIYASTNSDFAGKGEGIQVNTTGFTYGRRPIASGGGGGSDDNGGGAGGSNYSDGGEGGHGWTCAANPSGGIGGIALSSYISATRIFMGGGGGGGQQNNTVGTNGANGGGIILIKAASITTSGSSPIKISANGGTAGDSGNDGAGGGGAGGSVVISANTFSVPSGSPLSVESSGGAGGNVTDAGAHGGGGGGGQGVAIYSSAQPVTNVSTVVVNGNGGKNNSGSSTYAGTGSISNYTGIMASLGAVVLPVKLVDFTAQLRGAAVLLFWNTAMEQNNDRFEIQKSTNGIDFSHIGSVKGAGNSSTPVAYSFTDPSPKTGKIMYRLKQIDLDGNSAFSPIASVNIKEINTAMTIFPNPAKEQFTIQAPAVKNSACALSIIDLSGKTVMNLNTVAANGQVQVPFGGRLASGVYVMRLSYQQEILFSKIIIQ